MASIVPKDALPYFKAHNGPVLRTEHRIYREQHPEFTYHITTLRGYRTILVKNRVLEPIAENLKAVRKYSRKPNMISALASIIRTKQTTRNRRNRCFSTPIL